MQGMLTPHSQVSADGGKSWCPAREIQALSEFFRGTQKSGFGRRSPTPAPDTTQTAMGGTNFVLVLDIKAESNPDLELAISRLGKTTRIMRNTWVVHSTYTLGTLRNALVPHLRPLDSLFIADATHGKTAWFNLGVEVDARIRKVWKEDA